MSLYYWLLNLWPFAPIVLLATGLTWRLRASLWAWVAAGLVALAFPGCFLVLRLRDAGFNALGAACEGPAYDFMQIMQLVFLAEGVAAIAGCAMLAFLAYRRSPLVGAVAIIPMIGASFWTAFYIFFASAMTAVDSYTC